ncbi:MAG: acyl-CoA thioesterase [Rhodocyclaceae bacterium]|nr:acyl-CoA thioesterase [Rhodocyclaceae bacterium]
MSLVDMVLPDQCNHHGTLFGGAALAMLDKLAFILGSKLMRGPLVTAAVHRIEFRAPVPAGWLTECVGRVSHVGRRSVTIDARLYAEGLYSGERILCLTGEFVMVAKERATTGPFLSIEPNGVRVAEIVFPGHANHRGILHGGPGMAWIAKAGFVAATRHARQPLVMAASDRLDFHAPAYVGEVVEVDARVTKIGRTSLTVSAEMHAEHPETGTRRRCTTARLIFVSIDESGSPVSLGKSFVHV